MTKIDIFSGFLGAGKTTLIKKLIEEAYTGEKLVLIENEFGEIGVDGGFLQDAGVEITEMNSGCICCSLVGDFGEALKKVLKDFEPDRILIEPSGVGKLSDVIRAVQGVISDDVVLNGLTAVVDALKCKVYARNFGEFFVNQIQSATTVILSRTADISDKKLNECLDIIEKYNDDAAVITTDWNDLGGKMILETIEHGASLARELEALSAEETCPVCGCHHHDHEHDHEHEHHHDHEHEHDHDHEHHHDHEHDHEHHHHADEVFTSWGKETVKKYTVAEIKSILSQLGTESDKYGMVLRSKGIVQCSDGGWIHFDFVPSEENVRMGPAAVTGVICVIGSHINEDAIAALF